MKAVALERYLPIDDPASLRDVVMDVPVPAGRDLLVRVEAVSVNPVDAKVRATTGREQLIESPPRVLGFDAAGTVAGVGPDCELFTVGDRVFYAGVLNRQGSNAEFQLVDERLVGPGPRMWEPADAASLPLTALTAWEALFEHLGLRPGPMPSDVSDTDGADAGRMPPGPGSQGTLLVIAGGGGVGSMAVQMARWSGATVIATAGRARSAAWLRELGAHHVLDRHGDILDQLRGLGHGTVDRILCGARTDLWWDTMAAAVAPRGRICGIVDAAGPVDLNLLKPKSAAYAWEFMFTRGMYGTPDMEEQHRILGRVAALADAGVLRSTRTRTLTPISARTLREAHALVERGDSIGKTVLAGWP